MADVLTLLLATAGDAAPAAEPAADLGLVKAGLVIFVLVFVGIVAWVLMGRKGRFDREARIPLEDEPVTPIEDHSRGDA
jgi:cbb3-type cytochrome oxidase subunit 3